MGNKKCKEKGLKKKCEELPKPKKYMCKKCDATSNKEGRLCKPKKNKLND